jgi:hypothetical protein
MFTYLYREELQEVIRLGRISVNVSNLLARGMHAVKFKKKKKKEKKKSYWPVHSQLLLVNNISLSASTNFLNLEGVSNRTLSRRGVLCWLTTRSEQL